MGKGKKITQNNNKGSKDNVRWSDDMDVLLLNALVEEAMKGNRHDGMWTTESYNNVVGTLRLAIGSQITEQHINNRIKTLKDRFAEVYDLFNGLSGFLWNPTTKRFEAKEEVWEKFIQEKPSAAKWKKIQCKHYDTLKELFGTDRAVSKDATTTKERLKRWEKDSTDLNDMFDSNVNVRINAPYSTHNLDSFNPMFNQSTQLGETSTSKGVKGKIQMVDTIEAQYEKIASGINALAEAVKEGNLLLSKMYKVVERQAAIVERGLTIMQQSKPRHYSESDVWDALDKLHILDFNHLEPYHFLCGNEQKKRAFFGIPNEWRYEALIQMMKEADFH